MTRGEIGSVFFINKNGGLGVLDGKIYFENWKGGWTFSLFLIEIIYVIIYLYFLGIEIGKGGLRHNLRFMYLEKLNKLP